MERELGLIITIFGIPKMTLGIPPHESISYSTFLCWEGSYVLIITVWCCSCQSSFFSLRNNSNDFFVLYFIILLGYRYASQNMLTRLSTRREGLRSSRSRASLSSLSARGGTGTWYKLLMLIKSCPSFLSSTFPVHECCYCVVVG